MSSRSSRVALLLALSLPFSLAMQLAAQKKLGKAKIQNVAKGPGDRYAFCVALDARRNELIVFGGEQNVYADGKFKNFKFYNDVQVLELPTAKKWKDAQLSWTLVEVPKKTAAPSPRSYASMAQSTKKDELYLFGGFERGGKFLNDLWVFSLAKRTWQRLLPADMDAPLPKVRDASALVHDEKSNTLWLYSGLHSFQPMKLVDDLWKFDVTKRTWTEIMKPEKGKSWPEPRFLASMVAMGNGKAMLAFGNGRGAAKKGGNPLRNDAWELDMKTGKWSKRKNAPIGLFAASAVWNPKIKRMVVLGGVAEKDKDHVLAYDPKKNKWSLLGKVGTAKSYAAAACHPKTGDIFLTGGVVGGFTGKHPENVLTRILFK